MEHALRNASRKDVERIAHAVVDGAKEWLDKPAYEKGESLGRATTAIASEVAIDVSNGRTRHSRHTAQGRESRRGGGSCSRCGPGEQLVPATASRKGSVHEPNEAHIDHVEPRSRGGTNSNENLRVIGRDENLRKGNKTQ
jgi:hypothetical protein